MAEAAAFQKLYTDSYNLLRMLNWFNSNKSQRTLRNLNFVVSVIILKGAPAGLRHVLAIESSDDD